MTLLEHVCSPADVRALRADELPKLCEALRSEIIAVCGRVGGHLGASLGAVELIVALHRVYRTPFDRLVFDVGHQAYAHKILTGRRERMHTLRQAEGIAPFLDPSESEHDAFGAGHACTAISIATGMSTGLALRGHRGHVVAVVGDGALTGGLSFEGLNQAAVLPRGLLLVLNDNGMSISTNVGAVHRLLVSDARSFFEAMGFTYVGPVDGHDVHTLIRVFREAKETSKPTVVHARTKKGRGFEPAERDERTRGHAMGPYQWRDGKLVRDRKGQSTWSDAFAHALDLRMASDPRVVVVTPAMLEGSSLTALFAKYPGRVFDVGIAEQHAVTFAAGLATTGLRPVVCIYSTFLQRAYDQIIHDVALPRLPLVFAIDRAGVVGADGATHQGAFDVAFLRPVPGLSLTAPVYAVDIAELLEDALARERPSFIRFPRGVLPAVERPVGVSRAGSARWLSRPLDATVSYVTMGPLGLTAVEAAKALGAASVLDAGEVGLLDEVALIEAALTGALVVAEEGVSRGGLGDAVLEVIAKHAPGTRVRLVGMPNDRFVKHGEAHAQRRELGLDVEGLIGAARSLHPDVVA